MFDQPLAMLCGALRLLDSRTHLLWIFVPKSQFELRLYHRKWSSQLVAGISDEALLRFERGSEPGHQIIDRRDESLHFTGNLMADGTQVVGTAPAEGAFEKCKGPQSPVDAKPDDQ